MTRPCLPRNPALVAPGRRGGGAGEPASQPVPPSSGYVDSLLLDSREVARLLRIGRTKAFQMISCGQLPVIRIGRCARVPRSALELWILEHTESRVRNLGLPKT